MSAKSPFPDFSRLAANAFYLNPPKPAAKPAPSPPNLSASYVIIPPSTKPKDEPPPPPAPDLVLLFTWMNAAPKHIRKYITSYRTIYPAAKIVVTTTETMDFVFRSRSTQAARLRPVLDVIASVKPPKTKGKGKILLHAFSNGGSHSARVLATMYASKYSAPLPIAGMIIDSAPGLPTYDSAVRAFAAGIPPATPYPLYLLAMAAVHLIVIGFLLSHLIVVLIHFTMVQTPPPSWLDQLRLELIDPKLFKNDVPRAYIFSDKDVMVEESAVLQHAEEAKKAGYSNVRVDQFKGSAHVGHAVGDPKRYWSIVDSVIHDGMADRK